MQRAPQISARALAVGFYLAVAPCPGPFAQLGAQFDIRPGRWAGEPANTCVWVRRRNVTSLWRPRKAPRRIPFILRALACRRVLALVAFAECRRVFIDYLFGGIVCTLPEHSAIVCETMV